MPKGKHIINNKQKRAAALVYRLFAAHLQYNKKVDNVGLVPTNTY